MENSNWPRSGHHQVASFCC